MRQIFTCTNSIVRLKRNSKLDNGNYSLPEEWIDRRHPVDDIEPNIKSHDAIRDAREQAVKLINAGFAHIESAICRRGSTVSDIAVAFYEAAYALGLNICEGMSMTQRSDAWMVERATISKGATEFCRGHRLSPS